MSKQISNRPTCYDEITKTNYLYKSLFYLFIPFTFSICFIPLINFILTKNLSFFPTESVTLFERIQSISIHSDKIMRNLFSCLGFLFFTDLKYSWRPQWTFMWILTLIQIWNTFKTHSDSTPFKQVVSIFIITYFTTTILIADPDNGPYGFRFFIPGILWVTYFSLDFMYAVYINVKFSNMNK